MQLSRVDRQDMIDKALGFINDLAENHPMQTKMFDLWETGDGRLRFVTR